MYQISKRIEVAGSHQLALDYDSPCQHLHGHNWIITVHVEGKYLDNNGMLIDFKHIKEIVNQLDHAFINDVVDQANSTAEYIAEWVAERVQGEIDSTWKGKNLQSGVLEMFPTVTKVEVQESEGNLACYIP